MRETLDALIYPLKQYAENGETDASRFTPPGLNRRNPGAPSSSYAREREARCFLGRLQGPPHRDLRTGLSEPDHHVATTDSTVHDVRLVAPIHAHLAERGLQPDCHLVDAGYATAREVVTARRMHKVNLMGPILASTSWQTRDGGFSQADFAIDWVNRQVTCPKGAISSRWIEDRSQEGTAVVRARFPTAACRPCKSWEQCTRSNSKWDMGRRITLRPQAEYEASQQARTQEDTQEWKEQYAHQAVVEGTISQAVRAFGLRECRYHGLAKTRLQHQLTAAAMNFHHLNAWWTDTPRACTRTSHLAALRPAR